MNNFFVSDFHYGHKNIAGPKLSDWEKGYRDFDSIEDMNYAIVKSVNDVVQRDDTLYFLGDWSFGHESNILNLRNQLNVDRIIMVWGNHDKILRRKYKYLFAEYHELLKTHINGIELVMCHYPIARWENRTRGTIHLFGHEHHNYDNGDGCLDVGWCKWRRPLSLEEIVKMVVPVKGNRHD